MGNVIKIIQKGPKGDKGATSVILRGDNQSSSSINLNTTALTFTSQSNHGFGFHVSDSKVKITSPQDLKIDSDVKFNTVKTDGGFILLSSGSLSSSGGIIIQSGSVNNGISLGYSSTDNRWGISNINITSSIFESESNIVTVVDADSTQVDYQLHKKRGNLKIENNDAYIYL